VKPIEINNKNGLIIGIVLLILVVFGTFEKVMEFIEFAIPTNEFLTWRFFIIMIVIVMLVVWFIMNHFWFRDYKILRKAKCDIENLEGELKIKDNERLMDVITGIPNSVSLKQDLNVHLKKRRQERKFQFILIDLKDFRNVNNKFGIIKTNELLRTIAQTIYQKMRRNEDMYKFFYRLHTGGDEFAFLIEGEQVEALGFANRLVLQFNTLTKHTEGILGEKVKLSFHCAIVEMDSRDEYEDVITNAQACYDIAKKAKSDFTICWHPETREVTHTLDWQKGIYEKARELFEVKTWEDKDFTVG